MITINFIPQEQRRARSGLLSGGIAGIPVEIPFGVAAAVIGLMLLAHAGLLVFGLFRLTGVKMLEASWNSMGAQKKIFDDIDAESKAIQAKLAALGPVASQGQVVWAQVLNDISDSIPKGVWLTKMTFSGNSLVIEGSAVSKMRNEIVLAGNFVAALKEKQSVREYFSSLEVDSISRRNASALSIADFSLKAKLK